MKDLNKYINIEDMENINSYINQIIQISHSNLPSESKWKSFTIENIALRMFAELNAFYVNEFGKEVSFNPKMRGDYNKQTDLTFLFSDLRKEMYDVSPNMGAWFTCNIEVNNDGEFKVKYDYENKPNFAHEAVDEFYIDDLKKFPRERQLIPSWLKEILIRSNANL